MFTGDTGGDSPNDGAIFPSLIRVTGELIPAEQETNQKLIVFFNDMVPLDTSNPCFGPVGISCVYDDGGLSNTEVDKLTEYSASKRVIITTALNVKINVYIPVTTIAAKKAIGFFVATAT